MSELLILMVIMVSVTVFLFLGEKVRISAISIELILGMILGTFLFVGGAGDPFPSISNMFWLQFLADFGFILLMFLVGLELNISFLRKYFKKAAVLVLSIFFICFSIGLALGIFLQLNITASLLIGIVFAAASIAVVFPLIKELGFSQKRLGQILITATMALDIVCIIIISLIEFTTLSELNILQFVLIILIIIGAFLIIIFGINPFWRYMEKRTSDVKAMEWEIRISFAIILLLAVLTGLVLQIEEIIGAFLAGLIMGQSKSAPRLKEKFGSMGYGFFIPIFFFVIGMKADATFFADPTFLILLGIFLLILFAIKIGSGMLGSKIINFPWKTGLITGLIMIPSLSVGLAAAELGNNAGLFSTFPQMYTLLIFLIVISSILIPILTRSSAKRLIPTLISKKSAWGIHLEYDLGIYLDERYSNVFKEVIIEELPRMKSVYVNLDTPITTILEYMETYHQMNFPVISTNKQLLGMVDFDDVKRFILEDKLNETAGTVMRKEFIFVVPQDPLSIALDKMRTYDLELLPIVDKDTLEVLGTVTRDRILRFIRIRALGASITPEDLERAEEK